jgi:hypothetical protein
MPGLDEESVSGKISRKAFSRDLAFHPVYPVHPGSKRVFSQDEQDGRDKDKNLIQAGSSTRSGFSRGLDEEAVGGKIPRKAFSRDLAFHPVYPVHPGSKRIFSQDEQDGRDKDKNLIQAGSSTRSGSSRGLDEEAVGGKIPRKAFSRDLAFHPVYPVHPGSKRVFSQDEQDGRDKDKNLIQAGSSTRSGFSRGLKIRVPESLDINLRSPEVDEEAGGFASGFEVVEALGGVEVGVLAGGLEFKNHGPLYDQVRDEITHNDPVITDFDALLLDNRKAGLAKLVGQGVLVDLFKEAWPQRVRHLISAPDDPFRECIVDAHRMLQKGNGQCKGMQCRSG